MVKYPPSDGIFEVTLPPDYEPPIYIPPDTPTEVDEDTGGTVTGGGGSTSTAVSLQYSLSGIVAMAWAQEPYRVLWCVRSDGLLIGMTYRRDQGVLAWHRHPMVNGAVEDVAVIPDPQTGQQQVWLVVRRSVNGSTVRYIEKLTAPHEPTSSTDTDGFCYLDSSLTYSGAAVSTFSNLDHLEGQTVQVWADGVRHADKTVSGGEITLDREAETVTVGIHSPSYIQSLPASNLQSEIGSGAGRTKTISDVYVRFLDTIGGKVGPTATELDIALTRQSGDAQDATPAMQSGVKKLNMKSKHDREAQFYIVQDIPAPMTITALTPVYSQGDS